MGDYPITVKQFEFVEKLMPFTAFDDDGIVGFFTLRNPGESLDELRLGFVIIKPEKRGTGYGGKMLALGIKFAFELYGAKKVSLGVFDNNPRAYHCYKRAGFNDIQSDITEIYSILGEEWKCKEMQLELNL